MDAKSSPQRFVHDRDDTADTADTIERKAQRHPSADIEGGNKTISYHKKEVEWIKDSVVKSMLSGRNGNG